MELPPQRRQPQRRAWISVPCVVFGALSFIALLPFLYLQQDDYEQRRLLLSHDYIHASHSKGFRRRRNQKRGLKNEVDGSDVIANNRLTQKATPRQSPPQDEHDCLVVFHLPKTGGSSLLYALRFFALERGWEFYDYHGEQRQITGDKYGEPTKPVHRAIHYGHFYSTFLERSHTSQCLRMTLLRDPIDRVISHFYYWEGIEKDWPRVTDIAHDCDGNPLLRRHSNQFSNLMTRMLMGGGVKSGSTNAVTEGGDMYPPHLWHIFQPESSQCKYAYPLPEESATQNAINHLKNMDLVCFMDDLEGCLQNVRLLVRLPKGRAFNVPHKNSANANAAASGGKMLVKPHDMAMKNATIREWVASVNHADIALYDWALQNVKKG